jgi:hypothetical protein
VAELIKLGEKRSKAGELRKTLKAHTDMAQGVSATCAAYCCVWAVAAGTFEPIDDAFKITMTGGLRECAEQQQPQAEATEQQQQQQHACLCVAQPSQLRQAAAMAAGAAAGARRQALHVDSS